MHAHRHKPPGCLMVKRWPRPRAENPQLPTHKPRVTLWTEAVLHPTVVELVGARSGKIGPGIAQQVEQRDQEIVEQLAGLAKGRIAADPVDLGPSRRPTRKTLP